MAIATRLKSLNELPNDSTSIALHGNCGGAQRENHEAWQVARREDGVFLSPLELLKAYM